MYDIFYVNGSDSDFLKIKSKYPRAQHIQNVASYDDIKSKAFTKMFWVIWNDVDLLDSFNLTDYKSTKWDDMYVHVFKNGEHYDGICLFPKNLSISKREFEYRFFAAKKEIDILASTPKKYKIYSPRTYKEYNDITDEMFWIVWPEVSIIDNSVFDLYFSRHNVYDRKENHVFKHLLNNKAGYDNGIVLMSKYKKISQREFNYRFLVEKKEYDVTVSEHIPYDIVFISYNEPTADENYNLLLSKYPQAKRVHGVKGIHQAHIKAAELCSTDMIWVVDGDAVIVDDFNFSHNVTNFERRAVHVWRSRNPINDLEYGYGGVKLLPREMTINMDVNSTDMTTSIGEYFKAVDAVSNITSFNTDPFNTWKSAFRECVKLSSRTINKQNEEETVERLTVWKTKGEDRPFGKYAIKGANDGVEFGTKNKDNPEMLKKINDFEWLEEYFNGQN